MSSGWWKARAASRAPAGHMETSGPTAHLSVFADGIESDTESTLSESLTQPVLKRCNAGLTRC